ncbi:DNA repair protein RecO [Bacteroides sp. 214]|uniref:DNA repair protein RecO n=1 Tax=Bacteroides sp. 214 TaxID=2302935 RepID=UPI0013D71DBF|nr:DNA repair protein RecO [Bacteroides sp. 214]NDW12456.1 DNA repair protein RecO [Bacteroides sp. 214]
MLQKTQGIVLHVLKHKDTSNIVDVYTELNGRCSFIVPLSRSKKSAVKPVLFQPLSIIEFETNIRPNISLYRIKEARAAVPFTSIPYHPYKSAIALFLAEFLYRVLREEDKNLPLYSYLTHSIAWLDACEREFANFHLVFLMRLSRFLGLYPNLDDYSRGDYFDLLNASFTSVKPQHHAHYIKGDEAYAITQLMRMNYDTMHLFGMSRTERGRCLVIMNDYYRLHIPGFTELKSLAILQELFI